MTRKLLATFITMIVAGVFLFSIFFFVDPNGKYALQALVSVYIALFVASTSFFTLLLFFGKELLSQKNMDTRFFWISVRRGSFISLTVVFSLLLLYLNMFSFIEFFMLVLFFALLEFILYFSKK